MEQEKNIKILVCDDSEEIRELLSLLLGEEGYEVLLCRDGQEAVEAMDDTVSLAILDVVMPRKSGFDACREIREKSLAPILFLTAKTQDFDKTMGFAAGGDDYLSKPFSYSELISRVRALLRRYYVYQGGGPAAKTKTCYDLGGLVVDVKSRVAAAGGVPVGLTDIEFNLLALMAQSPGRVFSAKELYETIWQEPYFYSANNTVMVHIRNLRKKIEADAQNPKYIKTVWGKGYCVDEPHL